MRPLELIGASVGTFIVVNEQLIRQSLTTEEVLVVVLCYGMAASSYADRTGEKGPIEFIKSAFGRGGNGPEGGAE